jgi:ribosomal protein L40E
MTSDADENMQPPAAEAPAYQRVCRRCSAQTTTAEPNCPACGTPFLRPPLVTKRRMIIAAAALGAVLVGLGGWWAVQANQTRQAEEAAAARQAQAERAAEAKQAEAERAAEAKRAADALERSQRRRTVGQIQKSITKMARGHVSEGILDGPILNTQCSPVAGGSLEDLTDRTTKFSCLAVNEKLSGSRVSGYTYHAIMNWNSGKYSYGLGD